MIRRSVFLLTSMMLSLSALAHGAGDARARTAAWLTAELHQPITAQQVRSAPEIASFADCRIARIASALTGGSSIELRCAPAAPRQIVLVNLDLPPAEDGPAVIRSRRAPRTGATRERPLIHAGARLQADWHTDAMHAVLPVVALQAGGGGEEIRVRLRGGKRIYHARIMSAQSVEILREGT